MRISNKNIIALLGWIFLLSHTYGGISKSESNQVEIDSTLKVSFKLYSQKEYNKALTILLPFIEDIHIQKKQLLDINLYLGAIYMQIGDYRNSLRFYNEAEKLIEDIQKKIIYIHYNKAIIYRTIGDYHTAIQMLQNSLNNLDYKNYGVRKLLYQELGNVFHQNKNYQKAISCFEKSIDISRNYELSDIEYAFNSCAMSYMKLGKYKKAENYLLESIKFRNINLSKSHYPVAISFMNLGELKIAVGDTLQGLVNLRKAIDINLRTFGVKHYFTAQSNLKLGEYYLQTRNSNYALIWTQKSLISNVTSFNDTNILVNPKIEDVFPNTDLLDILKIKAEAFYLKWIQSKNVLDLRAYIKALELITEIVDKMRMGYLFEQSSFDLSSREKDTFIKIIHANINLYKSSNDKKYLKYAFKYSEKIKHATLKVNVRKALAKQAANIPGNLVEKEQEIRLQISVLQKLIHDENKLERPDSSKITSWQTELVNAIEKQDKLNRKLEQDYKNYYNLKYSTSDIDILQIRKHLNQDETLIDYTLTDSTIITLILTLNDIEVIETRIDSSFYNSLDQFKRMMYNDDFLPYKPFMEISHDLYLALIKPLENQHNLKNIIIVPDEEIAFVSFDILTTKPFQSQDITFKDIPYLIKKYAIRYQFSSSMLLNTAHSNNNRLLAFAPTYKFRDYGNSKYLQDEVIKISKIYKGNSFLEDNATETKFKSAYKDYGIIHLAMHGKVDTSAKISYSGLIFSAEEDTNDGILYNYEVYHMNFNAKMLVLSACKSGYGNLQKGDGIVNMARSFLQAGCRSIVFSLWNAQDVTDYNVYTLYYKYLRRGLDKSSAMRKAKLKYLKQADPIGLSPKAWGGIVVMGDNSSINSSLNYYLKIIVPFLVIISVIIVLKRKN